MGNTLKSLDKQSNFEGLGFVGDKSNLFSAVIFDMDGLVLDTEITYSAAWQKAATEMGYKFSDEFCLSMSGLHYQTIEKKLIAFCGAGFDLKKFNKLSGSYWRQYVIQHGIPIKKGFVNLLDRLAGWDIPFCLATNSRQVNALECLKLAGLEGVFSIIVSRDDVSYAKPAPDIFLVAAEYLKTPIRQCLVLEDSLTGIKAAVSATAHTVFIPSLLPAEQQAIDLANHCFNDLDELSQIIGCMVSHPV